MKKSFLVICFLLLSLLSFSQDYTLSGTILSKKTNTPLQDVDIQIKGTSIGTTSDARGNFIFRGIQASTVTLVFSHIGFDPQEKELEIKSSVNKIEILMIPGVQQLEEVQIMGISLKNNAFRTEDVDIKTLQGTNLQDVGYLLRQVPNVNGVRKGAMGIDPVIRGFKYSQLDVQVNGGTRIEGGCPNRMDPATAHVDLSDIKEMKILKGPFALKYGVNFGGVIDMTTYQPAFYEKYETHVNARIGGQTNHTGYKTRVGVSGANRFITYNVSGNWKKYDDYQAGNGEWVHSSLEQQSYSANLGFKVAKQHVVYASADMTQGADIDFPTLPMDERKDDTKIYSLNYLASDLGQSINFIRMKAYVSDVNHEMDNKNRPFSDTVVAISTIHARNTGGKAGINFNAGNAVMEVGGDYEHIYKDGERVKNLIMQPKLPRKYEDLWNNAHITNLGVFAEYQKLGKSIDWIVSARVDFNSGKSDPLLRTAMNGDVVYENEDTRSQHTNFSISGGLTWHISSSSNLIVSIGRGVRSPDMTERFIILLPVGYDRFDYLGNPQLLPEANNEIDLGYRFNHANAGQLEASAFFAYVTDFITGEVVPPSEIKPQTKGVLGVKRFINVDQAFLTGFELSYMSAARYDWLVTFTAAYTMGWNPEATIVNDVDGTLVTQIITNDPLSEIPPFEMNAGFGWRLFKNRFVPKISLRYAANQNRISEAYGEQQTPSFSVVNLDFEYRFSKYLSVFAGIKNLFDTAYYEHLNRRIIGSKLPLYEPGRVFYANLIFNL
jgi:iron complex outermembrane receptor protein